MRQFVGSLIAILVVVTLGGINSVDSHEDTILIGGGWCNCGTSSGLDANCKKSGLATCNETYIAYVEGSVDNCTYSSHACDTAVCKKVTQKTEIARDPICTTQTH